MKKTSLLTAALLAVVSFSVNAAPVPHQPTPAEIAKMEQAQNAMMHKVAHATIQKLDKNHDGKVSLQEFLDNAREGFKRLDANHDGYITEAEYLTAMQHMIAGVHTLEGGHSLASNGLKK